MAITLTINNVNNPINVNNTGGTITLTIGTGGIALISQLNDVNLTNLTDNQILVYDAATEKWVNENNSGGGGGSGTVTNVAMTVPTGLTVTGSPITTTGTFALAYSAGYVGYTTSEQTKLSGIETNADVTDATNVAAAGAFMKSVDDTDDITVGTTNKFATQTEKDKLANITVTQAVNLDTIEADSHTHSNKSILDDTTASFTTADETKLDGIEALADVTDSVNVGSVVAGVSEKTTPIDADTLPLTDSAAANVLKKLSWSNIKATLKTYFDTVYQAAGSYLTSANITQTITNGVTTNAPSEDAVFDALAGKQATLVSGTNIKTINGTTLLGSGDLVVSGSLTNWTEAYSAATQATSSFTATNAATNVNAALIAKGTGAIVANVPDGTTTGGNSRGQYSVDLQRARSSAGHVSAGNYNVIAGGQDNQTSGSWSTIGGGFSNYGFNNGMTIGGGYDNINGGTYSTVGGGIQNNLNGGYGATLSGGAQNYVNGDWSNVAGGYLNQTNVVLGSVLGGRQANAFLYGCRAHSAGQFAALADAQYMELFMRRAITGTTIAELFLDGSSVRAILPSTNAIWNARVQLVAVVQTVGNGTCTLGDTYISEHMVGIKRIGTTTSLVGTAQATATAQADTNMSSAVTTISADDTNEALKVEFTPPSTAGTTTVIRVFATVQLSQIKY